MTSSYAFEVGWRQLPLLLLLLADAQAISAPISSQDGSTVARLGPQDQQLRKDIAADILALQQDEWRFWVRNGPDPKYGGFYGTLDRRGSPISPESKGVVQQARHAWSFSAFYRAGFGLELDRPGGTPRSQQLAQTAYEFVAKHMRDAEDNLYYWSVTRDGKKPVHAHKSIYAQSFVIYAFSYYHGTFSTPKAKKFALECFWAMDGRWHNSSSGGYNELWSNSNDLPFRPDGASLADYVMPRSINIMMHLVECLLALHKVTRDSPVLQRLLELMDIFCNKLQLSRGHLMSLYDPVPQGAWLPAPGSVVSYGHNLEAVWMLVDAADYLEFIGAISRATRVTYYRRLMSVGIAALRDGYDRVHGGVFESGLPGSGPTSRVKVWWVQDEIMLAVWKLYKYYNNNIGLLKQLAGTSRFVRQYLKDSQFGGLFWQVAEDGAFNIQYDPGPNVKGNVWKASYHSTRAVLTLDRWLKQGL